LKRLFYIGHYSLLKTLANKHQAKKTDIIAKLKKGNDWIYRYGRDKEIKVFQLKDLDTKPRKWASIDNVPETAQYILGGTELLKRLNAKKCEYCGTEAGHIEVHHVRKLSDIKDGKKAWEKLMMARRRKTMVLCAECHQQLTQGKLVH